MLLDGNLQPKQQFARTRLGRVAVVLGEMSLKIGRQHVIVVACLRICVDRVTLGHGIPHFRVAHQDHIEHAEILESELILTQFAHASSGFERDVARGGFKIAADDFHQGRFARPIGANQAIAVAIPEFDTDVLEQRLRSELDGEV